METLPFDDVESVTNQDLLTIKMASQWASNYVKKNVTPSNISYLLQYGRVGKISQNGLTLLSRRELQTYYDSFHGQREVIWKEQLDNDLNWRLSFDYLKEADTTKHVHRLHPYKGKFIPQLVEYFLDSNTDAFKREAYFRSGDIVLDPFCGSGTTLVQANELGLHAVGIDVSAFNALMGNIKVAQFDLVEAKRHIACISAALRDFLDDSHISELDRRLAAELAKFNAQYFPSPDFKRQIACKEINDNEYAAARLPLLAPVYAGLLAEYGADVAPGPAGSFLDTWYLRPVREEIRFVLGLVEKVADPHLRKLLSVILSRTVRSCRATTHADLATLKEPVTAPYYCAKHGKVCKPLFSIQKRWEAYSKDTLTRLAKFAQLRTTTQQFCLQADSRMVDIPAALAANAPQLGALITNQKIRGIFSSPPYVGLIDYHEQHAYAYDLLGLARSDEHEIGRLFHGQGRLARESYAQGVADVLLNCRRFLVEDYNIFLVANDKYNLYPVIAERAGMSIVNRFKRPVLNRTERDRGAYTEVIFHLKEKS